MKEYKLDLYQFYHRHHLMALDQTQLEIYDLEFDLYAMTIHIMSRLRPP
jgi:hypothetical protein